MVRQRIRNATVYGGSNTTRRRDLRELWTNIHPTHPARRIVRQRIIDEVELARRSSNRVEAKRALENLAREYRNDANITAAVRKARERLNSNVKSELEKRTKKARDNYLEKMRTRYVTGAAPSYRPPSYPAPRNTYQPPVFGPTAPRAPSFIPAPPSRMPDTPRAPLSYRPPNLGGSPPPMNLKVPRTNMSTGFVMPKLNENERVAINKVGGVNTAANLAAKAGGPEKLGQAAAALNEFPNVNKAQEATGLPRNSLIAAKQFGTPENAANAASALLKIKTPKPRKTVTARRSVTRRTPARRAPIRKTRKQKKPEIAIPRPEVIQQLLNALTAKKLAKIAKMNLIGNTKNNTVRALKKHALGRNK